MDYSENYVVKYQDELSALYYDSHQILMNPWWHIGGELRDWNISHSLASLMSSGVQHPPPMRFLKKLVPALKEL